MCQPGHCESDCHECKTSRCLELGERLQDLDAKIELTHGLLNQAKSLQDAASVMASIGGKSLNLDGPDVDGMKANLEALLRRRDETWDELARTGCELMGVRSGKTLDSERKAMPTVPTDPGTLPDLVGMVRTGQPVGF